MEMGNIVEAVLGKQMFIAAVFVLGRRPLSKPRGARCVLNFRKSQNFERYGTYTEYLYNTPWEGWVVL